MHLLQSTYGEQWAKEKQALQREYFIGNTRVCFAFVHLAPTMRKYFAGQPDMRKELGSAKTASYNYETVQATQACNNFLELYQSAAEALPEDDKCAGPAGQLACSWGESCLPDIDTSHPLTVACVAEVVGLPVRYIQHSQLSDLYWQFWSEWSVLAKWQACTLCFKFQAKLRSPSLSEGTGRTGLQAPPGRPVSRQVSVLVTAICCAIPVQDHSKFARPRFDLPQDAPRARQRDQAYCHVHWRFGAWLECAVFHGPSASHGRLRLFLEVLAQAVQSVFLACSPDRPLPENLVVVVADNTVKSAKNQHVLKFLTRLVSLQIFRSALDIHMTT